LPAMETNMAKLLAYVDANPFDMPEICNIIDREMRHHLKRKEYRALMSGIDVLCKLIDHSLDSAYNYVARVCLCKQLLQVFKTMRFECILRATRGFLSHGDLETFGDCDEFIEIGLKFANRDMIGSASNERQIVDTRVCGLLILAKLVGCSKVDFNDDDNISCFVTRIISVCLPAFDDVPFETMLIQAVSNREFETPPQVPTFAEVIDTDLPDVKRLARVSSFCMALLLKANSSVINYVRLVLCVLEPFENSNWEHYNQLINVFTYICLGSLLQQHQQAAPVNLSHILLTYIRELLFALNNDKKLEQQNERGYGKKSGAMASIDSNSCWIFPQCPFDLASEKQVVDCIAGRAVQRVRVVRSRTLNYDTDSDGIQRDSVANVDSQISHYNDLLQVMRLVSMVDVVSIRSRLHTFGLLFAGQTNPVFGSTIGLRTSADSFGDENANMTSELNYILNSLTTSTSVTSMYTVLDDFYSLLCLVFDTVLRSPCCRHSVHRLVDTALKPLNTASVSTLPCDVSSKDLKQNIFDVTKIMNTSFQLAEHKDHAKLYLIEEELLHRLFEQVWTVIGQKAVAIRSDTADLENFGKNVGRSLILPALVEYIREAERIIQMLAVDLAPAQVNVPDKHKIVNSTASRRSSRRSFASKKEFDLLDDVNVVVIGEEAKSPTEDMKSCLTLLVLNSMSIITHSWSNHPLVVIGRTKLNAVGCEGSQHEGTVVLTANSCIDLLDIFLQANDWYAAKLVTSVMTNILSERCKFNASSPLLSLMTSSGQPAPVRNEVDFCDRLLFGDLNGGSGYLNSLPLISFVRGFFSDSVPLVISSSTADSALSRALSSFLVLSEGRNLEVPHVPTALRVQWEPLSYHCVCLIRDTIFNALCSVFEEQPLWTVACWDIQVGVRCSLYPSSLNFV
jgi:hypothetical protein